MTKPFAHPTALRPIKATLACAAFGVTCLAVPAMTVADAPAGEARSGETRLAESRGGDSDRERRGKSCRGKNDLGAEELREKMESRAERRFNRMDASGDGEVTLDEYVAASLDRFERRVERWQARGERRAERMEARADRGSAHGDRDVRDRRGHRRGARRAFSDFRDMSPEERRDHVRARAEERFEGMDENGDGVLSFGEYWGAIEDRIERRAERKERGTWRQHRR